MTLLNADTTSSFYAAEKAHKEHKTHTQRIPDIDKFSHHFDGSLLWNLRTTASQDTATYNTLTRLAQKKHWSSYDLINTDLINPDPGNPHRAVISEQFPCYREQDPFLGFKDYDQLPRHRRLDICWQVHHMEISDILHGEQLALLCASQLISLMPCMEGRLFASTQAADEARHVEFFRHYLSATSGELCPPAPAIRHLALEALQHPAWEFKLLICQILVESLALAQFNYLIKSGCPDLLQQGLRRILDDEARHVKFGTSSLKSLFSHYSTAQLHACGHYVVNKAFELAASDNHCLAAAKHNAWNAHDLRRHLRQRRIQRPEFLQQRFRQLTLNIRAAGLMSVELETRLQRYSGT